MNMMKVDRALCTENAFEYGLCCVIEWIIFGFSCGNGFDLVMEIYFCDSVWLPRFFIGLRL